MQKVMIGSRGLGAGEPCLIIAEAGSNHDGRLEQALALIDCAAECGADAVKFQTFTADGLVAPTDHPIARLTDSFGQFGATVHAMFQKLEMPVDWLPQLWEHAARQGIMFLSTPFDERGVDILNDLGVCAFKIASFEMIHLPLLRYAARTNKPLIVSTGMGDLADIEDALDTIYAENNQQVVLLHCGINYPAQFNEINLAAMDTMRQAFQVPVGYSDHTVGLTVPVAAVARGANVIEKHFTLDHSLHGPDHHFALDPRELKQMVKAVRDAEAAIGSPIKTKAPTETLHYQRGRRSVFAVVDIPVGTTISADMLAVLRPGVGLAPKFLDVVIGRAARAHIRAFQPITWDLI